MKMIYFFIREVFFCLEFFGVLFIFNFINIINFEYFKITFFRNVILLIFYLVIFCYDRLLYRLSKVGNLVL